MVKPNVNFSCEFHPQLGYNKLPMDDSACVHIGLTSFGSFAFSSSFFGSSKVVHFCKISNE
jgi:hypothetical protein